MRFLMTNDPEHAVPLNFSHCSPTGRQSRTQSDSAANKNINAGVPTTRIIAAQYQLSEFCRCQILGKSFGSKGLSWVDERDLRAFLEASCQKTRGAHLRVAN